jgi:hypothetical protein
MLKANKKSQFKTSENTQLHIPEDQKPRMNSCETPQNSKKNKFLFFVLYNKNFEFTFILTSTSEFCPFTRYHF